MSLDSLITRNNYVGNDAVSIYNYSFKILQKQDMSVYVRLISTGVETLLVEGVDYTVTGVKNKNGGTIVLIDAAQAWLTAGKLKALYAISLLRIRELKQKTDIKNQGDFYPEAHEDTFDGLVMNDQYLQDQLNRSSKLPASIDPTTFDMNIPATLVGAVSRSFITNATGDGWELGPTADNIANAQAYADAAAVSEANALASENAAADSATAALNSENNAAQSEVDAANYANQLANQINGSRAVPINVSASGIAFSGNQRLTVYFIQGNAGNVTVTNNPAILPGSVVGQRLILIGRNDSALVQLNDGNGLDLNGMCILGASSVLELIYDGVNWLETSRR